MKTKKTVYYAYHIKATGKAGTTTNWSECQAQIKGQNALYKKFDTNEEALTWLKSPSYEPKEKKKQIEKIKLKPGVYFDAGTGRGIGVEVKVTDKDGNNLMSDIVPPELINEYGNYNPDGKTNNYGELMGLYIALKYAIKHNIKNIYGDSKLVIDYWSLGRYKSNLPDETKILIQKVTTLRTEFTKHNGTVEHISGDINPADLGFHKK